MEKLRMGVDNGAQLLLVGRLVFRSSSPFTQDTLDFLVAGKLSAIGFGQTALDLLDLPLIQCSGCLPSLHAGAPKRTDTSFDTPGSCMVTP